jgi:hypothetical protein
VAKLQKDRVGDRLRRASSQDSVTVRYPFLSPS